MIWFYDTEVYLVDFSTIVRVSKLGMGPYWMMFFVLFTGIKCRVLKWADHQYCHYGW